MKGRERGKGIGLISIIWWRVKAIRERGDWKGIKGYDDSNTGHLYCRVLFNEIQEKLNF